MENQGKQDYVEMESEEFPDEFQCCVCLDIMYKPVVLACGHISCFWCVFKAMDFFQQSHCPVCRNPYNHFPRICKLLHFLLLKLYPSAYTGRGRQVAEAEKELGHASPEFEDNLLNSKCNEVLDAQDTSSPLFRDVPVESNSTCGDDSLVQDSSKKTSCRDNMTTHLMSSSSQMTDEANCMVERKETSGTLKQVLANLLCAMCKQLLFRPVVLNCGHVYCEACINTPHDIVCNCPVCRSLHPNGFPNVCLVLEHFLEEHFPEEYAARKESSAFSQNASPSGSSAEKREQAAQCSSMPTNVYSPSMSGEQAEFHPGFGCDYCGMFPIIGKRYKCKDCVEKIGFDLCEGCYNCTSMLPGRFNQQHTQEHQFVEVPPQNLTLSLGADHPEGFAVGFVDPDNPEEVYTVREWSNSASEHELENTASINSSDDELQD